MRYHKLLIWVLRIVVGCVFVVSGIAKLIDPWGFIYKIDQYLMVWGMSMQRTITLVGAIAIAGTEFVCGVLLATGCFKRIAVWILTAAMAVMLPLTFYIMIADPVSDCGCFGDMFAISNEATFAKNVLLSVAIIYLLLANAKAKGMFHPVSQWLVAVVLWAYAIVVGCVGYNVQPMIDFRAHPVGSEYCVNDDTDTSADADRMTFVYERGGERKEFTTDNLPNEEDGWEFVERIDNGPVTDAVAATAAPEVMTVYDEDGEDVTDRVFSSEGTHIVILIPDLRRADISYTYLLNELNKKVTAQGAEFDAIMATDSAGIMAWRDIAMADYPCYTASDTDIKELARGNIALMSIEGCTITGKRNIWSLDDAVIAPDKNLDDVLNAIAFDGHRLMWKLTTVLIAILLALWGIQEFFIWTQRQKKHQD